MHRAFRSQPNRKAPPSPEAASILSRPSFSGLILLLFILTFACAVFASPQFHDPVEPSACFCTMADQTPAADQHKAAADVAPTATAADNSVTTPAVRFASETQQITSSDTMKAATDAENADPNSSSREVTAEEIKAFTKSFQNMPLQERRLNTFQFEAFSLPPSRVRCIFTFH